MANARSAKPKPANSPNASASRSMYSSSRSRGGLRMPQQLHRRLSLEAEREGISLNQWINAKLSSR
ncbi:MAG: toxin-antitoxin system HicB family antitoxin [Acidobacteria bacterium]|nr:toxin-antitoxin system HicB family antitoxin [Acidobacteriota bacterium]